MSVGQVHSSHPSSLEKVSAAWALTCSINEASIAEVRALIPHLNHAFPIDGVVQPQCPSAAKATKVHR
jgi:hypothetical protein